MHQCPHCKQPGIGTMQKLMSVSFAPARCSLCHELSYLHIVHGLYALITWIMLTWVFIGIALYQHMSIYLIGTIPAFLLAVDSCMVKAPMVCVIDHQ